MSAQTDSDDVTKIVPRPSEPDELRPGDVLRERFVIERLIGEGGMGQVFLAVDREAEKSNPHVALKMLGQRFKDHPQSLKALRREATQSRRLNHPNIVNVYDFDRTDEHVFMVMEFMRGNSLDVFITRHSEGSKLDEVWSIIDACGQALQYIHEQRIIHSDFKPGNVFMTEDGEIKVLDLGIARSLDESNAAEGTTRFDPDALGALTPQYASCEMFEGLTPTAQDDLFALACVTYELLTGAHPYLRKTALEARAGDVQPKRPKGLKSRQWKTLSAALAYTRAGRPENVTAFLSEMAPEKSRSSPLPWIAVATFALVVTTIVVVLQFRSADDRFLQVIMDQYATNPDNPAGAEKVAAWLKQGNFFLDLGRRSMDKGNYKTGAGTLLNSPGSAFQSFRLVLTRSDDSEAKNNAGIGMLEISKAFKNTAQWMMENDVGKEDTAKTVCRGLEVNRFDPELLEPLKLLNGQITGGVTSVPECRELLKSGKVKL